MKSPDFEKRSDEYKVTVTANDADLIEVTITITNMEEDAVVTVAPPRPQIGNPVTASVKDEDGDEDDRDVDVGEVPRHDGVDAHR